MATVQEQIDLNPQTPLSPATGDELVVPVLEENRGIKKAKKKIIILSLAVSVILLVISSFALLAKNSVFNFNQRIPNPLNNKITPQIPTETPLPTPTPVSPGRVEGKVIDSFDDQAKANLTVRLLGVQNYTLTSSEKGAFTFENIPVGEYKINAEDNDNTTESKDVVVESEKTTQITLYAFLKNPKPSLLKGTTFEDKNSNGVQDGGEPGTDVMLSIKKINKNGSVSDVAPIMSDKNGNYSYTLPAPAKYSITPLYKTFYKAPDSKSLTSRGYGSPLTASFGYIPETATGGLKIYVFNDKNENGQKDGDEEYIHYEYVEVVNQTTGKSFKTGVGVNGTDYPYGDFGHYTFTMIPQDASWAYYYKITKGSTTADLTRETTSVEVYLGAHKLE